MSTEEIRQIFTTGGKTLPKFTPSSSHILVASPQDLVKAYDAKDDTKEPTIIDTIPDTTSLVVLPGLNFIAAGKDGEVKMYTFKHNEGKEVATLFRSMLPVRDIVLSHDGRKIIITGDDNEVNIVDLKDHSNIIKFSVEDQVHGASYSDKLNLLALSLSNGEIRIYDCISEQPECVKVIPNEIPRLVYQDGEDDEEDNWLTTRVAWSNWGDEFAVPCASKLIKVFTRSGDFKQSYSFPALQQDKLVDLKYDPSGKLLASLDLKGKLIIWDAAKREAKYEKQFGKKLRSLCWGKGSTSNELSIVCGIEEGEILMLKDVVELPRRPAKPTKPISEMEEILAMDTQDNLEDEEEEADDINIESEKSDDENDNDEDLRGFINDGEDDAIDAEDMGTSRRGYGLESDAVDHEDDDDEEEGLFVDSTRKRKLTSSSSRQAYSSGSKRSRSNYTSTNDTSYISYSRHEYSHIPYSAGSTPFGTSNKRFLTMNNIGHVHTVKQEEFSSITVTFFDRSDNSEGYNFEDYDNFDLGALSAQGLLLGLSKKRVVTKKTRQDALDDDDDEEQEQDSVVSYEGIINYRSHSRDTSDQWTKKIPLERDEVITTLSVSSNICLVGTSLGFLRYFSLEGIPIHYEQTLPLVASAINDTNIFIVMLQNEASLVYSMYDIERTCLQKELSIPIQVQTSAENLWAPIKTLFFSTHGHPTLVSHENIVLTLTTWRQPLQSYWVPILNCQHALEDMGGKHVDEMYIWPLGLHQDELMLIAARGSEDYPVAPLPMPDHLKAKLEICVIEKDNEDIGVHEETLIKSRVFGELLESSVSEFGELFEDDQDRLQDYNTSIEKSVLVLFSKACAERENKRALSLVLYMRNLDTVRLAMKMAQRVGDDQMVRKIGKLIERKQREEEENIFSD